MHVNIKYVDYTDASLSYLSFSNFPEKHESVKFFLIFPDVFYKKWLKKKKKAFPYCKCLVLYYQ